MGEDDDESADDAGPDLRVGVPASDLPEGGTLSGSVAGEAVLLARVGGRVHAVGATCTHLGGPLGEGVLVDGQVRCPWHHARFAVATGEAVGAPALDALLRFAVEERDGRVFVTGRRPRKLLCRSSGNRSGSGVALGAAEVPEDLAGR